MRNSSSFSASSSSLAFSSILASHRIVLKALDARGEAIAAELAQAAKLRQEATALLASFEKKSAEAEANAAAIVAEARAQAEQLNVEAAERLKEFIARRTKQAEAKIALAEAQATAEVRAAAAEHAAKAAEIVLTDQMKGVRRRRSGGARNRRDQAPPLLRR